MTLPLHEQQYRPALSRVLDTPITVCGAGAIGANLIESLARMGFRNLKVIDKDRVDSHNLSTQPWLNGDIGNGKVATIGALVYRAAGVRIKTERGELTAGNARSWLAGSGLVLDCFDNIPSRLSVLDATRELHVPCLHLAFGLDSNYAMARWDDAYTLPDRPVGVDGCDYPLTRSLMLLTTGAGIESIIRFLLDGERVGFDLMLPDLRLMPS